MAMNPEERTTKNEERYNKVYINAACIHESNFSISFATPSSSLERQMPLAASFATLSALATAKEWEAAEKVHHENDDGE